jgi:hypothetical protein
MSASIVLASVCVLFYTRYVGIPSLYDQPTAGQGGSGGLSLDHNGRAESKSRLREGTRLAILGIIQQLVAMIPEDRKAYLDSLHQLKRPIMQMELYLDGQIVDDHLREHMVDILDTSATRDKFTAYMNGPKDADAQARFDAYLRPLVLHDVTEKRIRRGMS